MDFTKVRYYVFCARIRNSVASRTYFASRMIIDFLRYMPKLPSVFIGLSKLARMESRAAAGVLVVRAESVERRRMSLLNRVVPSAIRDCHHHQPFLDLRAIHDDWKVISRISRTSLDIGRFPGTSFVPCYTKWGG